ncbi:MAG: LamG-like jellyroll fold domain-containing protein, partial [Ferruginibacter sp.]
MEKKFYSKQTGFAYWLRRSRRISLNAFFVIFCIFSVGNILGQTGRALNFDGTNDRVDLPFVVSNSYTKEAWVFATSSTQDNNIVSGASTALWVPTATGKLTAGHSSGFNQVQDPAAFAINVWTHVAVTFDASTSSIRLYKNGIAVDSAIGTVPAYTETALYIGAFAAANNFKGSIDEVRIWNTVRTGAQISGNMNCNLTGDEPGLLAYFNFNQGTGGGTNTGLTTLTDISDKCIPNSGTLVNFALTGATSNWIVANPGVNTACSAPSPNINVTGNATCIPIGSTVPSLTNFTDFGDYGVNPIVRTFTIQNTGNANLTISSVTITGPGASNYTITTAAGTPIAGGSSTTLGITFNPSAPIAAKNATVTITNNDADEGNFTFNITGFNRGPGHALDFDGTNDLINLPNLISSGSYTKEAWVYSYNSAVGNNIVSGNNTAFWAPNSLGFKLTAGHAPSFNNVQDATPLVANTWTHVAVTYDAAGGVGNMILYKNGMPVASSGGVAPTYTETTQYIGAFQGGNLWNGKISEVRIWNTVRTASEILAARDSVL